MGCFIGLISPEIGVVVCSKRIVIEILDKTGHGMESCFLEVKGMRNRNRNMNRNRTFSKGNLY